MHVLLSLSTPLSLSHLKRATVCVCVNEKCVVRVYKCKANSAAIVCVGVVCAEA